MARTKTPFVHNEDQVSTLLAADGAIDVEAPNDGFLRFFDPGLNILELRDRVKDRGRIFCPLYWYDTQDFAKKTDMPQMRCLRMTAVPGSFRKTFAEQQVLLSPEEEVPSARTVVMGMVIHFLAIGQRLFPDHHVRTSDVGSGGSRVYVGVFGDDGFGVDGLWDGYRYGGLGLASARKF